MPDKLKTCSKCGETKPLDEYYKQAQCKYGVTPDCKECRKARVRANRAANLAHYSEYERSEKRAARRRERERARDAETRARVAKKRMENYYANHEAHTAKKRAYYEANRETINAKRRDYLKLNAASVLEQRRRWAERNPDKVKAISERAYKKNPAAYKRRAMERRARVAAVTVHRIDRNAIYDRDGGHCRACNIHLDRDNWHLDHIVPIALGGPHEWANVQALCPTCNLRKHAKLEGQIALPV